MKKIEGLADEISEEPRKAFEKHFSRPDYLIPVLDLQTENLEELINMNRKMSIEEAYDILARHADVIKGFYQQFHDMLEKALKEFPEANTFVVSGP